jgi:hypothetical protein
MHSANWALREFSWATYGTISRFESEPFGDLFSLGPKLRPQLSAARHATP